MTEVAADDGLAPETASGLNLLDGVLIGVEAKRHEPFLDRKQAAFSAA